MANDFSSDSNCKALWKFESGALTTDSKGGNTLTDYNTCGTDGADYKEGSQSVDLTPSEALYITDANLDSGFPLKNSDTNKIISIATWFKLDAQSVYDGIVSKYASGIRSFILGCGATATNLSWYTGYNNGDSFEEDVLFSSLVTGRWYHIGIAYNNSGSTVDSIPDKGYRAVLWDDTAGDYHASTSTGTMTNAINVEDAGLCIGSWLTSGAPTSTYCINGHIDETVIFDDVLTTTEIDQIRAGTYGAAGSTLLPTVNDSIFIQENIININQLSGVSIYDEVAITEYISITTAAGIIININDQVSIFDYTSVEVSPLLPFVYTDIIVSEEVTLAFDSFISVADLLTVSEYNTISITTISDLNISKFDIISVTEYIAMQNILGSINTYDNITVMDTTDVICELSGISVYDTIVINEDVVTDVAIPTGYQIAVSDAITLLEDIEFYIPEYYISIFESVVVSESVRFSIAFILGTLQINAETVCIEIQPALECIDIFADIGYSTATERPRKFARVDDTIVVMEYVNISLCSIPVGYSVLTSTGSVLTSGGEEITSDSCPLYAID
ncbi:MAG: hypothetical protein KAS32_01110 [Candidatus Peribacteraceae bacterium]|nr:hypothetical protein [Candidatus Peribacteraceae bacterium]